MSVNTVPDLQKAESPDAEEQALLEQPIAYLTLIKSNGEQESEIPIYTEQETWFGREIVSDTQLPFNISARPHCYTLDDPNVSKKQFRIYTRVYENANNVIPPFVYCEDLQSSNGTFINGQCIGKVGSECIGYLLSHGDVVEVKPFLRFNFNQPCHKISEKGYKLEEEMKHFQNQFEISDRLLGEGYYGAVYLAKELATSRQIACKVVNLNEAAHRILGESERSSSSFVHPQRIQEGKDRIKRELRILKETNHAHIINLRKSYFSASTLYIFTDLAQGGDLFSYLNCRGGFLPDLEARFICRQILLALKHLHSNGIAHRDIKPENILMMRTAWGSRIVLTDFGFANHTCRKTGRLHSRLGTEGYTAPEIDSSEAGYTVAADLWSLGIMVILLLTGRSEKHERISMMIEEVLGTRGSWYNITPAARKFLEGLLNRDPGQRMTATEALRHSWLTKPEREAAELEAAYQRLMRFWEKRAGDAEVVETIQTSLGPSSSRARKRNMDASLSHIGLEHRLNPKPPSTQKETLKKLNDTGVYFLSSSLIPQQPNAQHFVRRQSTFTMTAVEGCDMFGQNSALLARPAQPEFDEELDEVDQIPTTPVAHNRKVLDSSGCTAPSSSNHSLAEIQVSYGTKDAGSTSGKRLRVEEEDRAEMEIHEAATKQLPPYSTAKELKDCVNKIKRSHQLDQSGKEGKRFRFQDASSSK